MLLDSQRTQSLKESRLASQMAATAKSEETLLHAELSAKPKKRNFFFSQKRGQSSSGNKKVCTCVCASGELAAPGGETHTKNKRFKSIVKSKKFAYKLNYEMKEKNSTIKEDPSSTGEMSNIQQILNKNATDYGTKQNKINSKEICLKFRRI